MKDNYNLTKGSIFTKLLMVSLPVMLTSLVQMAYNLTDLFWLGQVSGDAVASAGFAGFFTWLGAAVVLLVRIGTEVRVSQRVGRGFYDDAKVYAKTGIQLEFLFGLLYAAILFVFADQWINFYSIESSVVHAGAVSYLRIVSIGMTFYLLNPVFSASLNGTGNTLWPFIISFIGLALNMILDPILILGFDLGVEGAAIATVIAQISVSVIFILYFRFRDSILTKAKYFSKIDPGKAKDILRLGMPAAIQSALFTLIAMVIARIVEDVSIGSSANAAQKIGSQIESLSWLVAGGISTALGAFVGQNYGAEKYQRVLKGVRYSFLSMVAYGVVITGFLYLGAEFLFSIFIPKEPDTILIGTDYLRILAISQIFMIIEAVIGGAFNGLGKTVPQSIVGIVFNALRIPGAWILSSYMGLNGIWWAISLSSVLKGIVLAVWFKLYVRKTKLHQKADVEDLDINSLNGDMLLQ
jgi:putative MATE family efflux protein